MSDNYLRIIPAAPVYAPASEQREAALWLVRRLLPGKQVTEQVYERPMFIDCGANLERILCPHCAAELAMERWQEAMDDFDREAGDVELMMPCCGRLATVNGLIYDWPCGVAQYEVEVMNPEADLDRGQVAEIELALGCPVRLIWQHL